MESAADSRGMGLMEREVVEIWNFRPSVLCRQLPLIYPVLPRRPCLVQYMLLLPRAMGKTVGIPPCGEVTLYFKYALQPRAMPTIRRMKENAQEKRRYRDAITKGNVYRIASSTFDRTHSMEKIPYYQKNGVQSR